MRSEEWLFNNNFIRDQGNNWIHSSAVVANDVILGTNNYIGPYCVIGMPPESASAFSGSELGVRIGNDNIFHGSVVIDAGAEFFTVVGDGCFIMKGVHIGHDCRVDANVVIASKSVLGGYVRVMEGVNIGLSTIVHQRHLLGAGAQVGMGTVVPKGREVRPFQVFAGNPGRLIGENLKYLERKKISDQKKFELICDYHLLNDQLLSNGFAVKDP